MRHDTDAQFETAAHERLYRNLRQRIMLGELPPGLPMTLRGIAASIASR